MSKTPTPSPCPVYGELPRVGDLSFLTKIVWCDCRIGLAGVCPCAIGSTHAEAVAAWNALYPPPAPEPAPEPVTPRRWWWIHLHAHLDGWGGYAVFGGRFSGDTEHDAIDKARESAASRDDGGVFIGNEVRATASELTASTLATMLAESRAWYARELERSGGGGVE